MMNPGWLRGTRWLIPSKSWKTGSGRELCLVLKSENRVDTGVPHQRRTWSIYKHYSWQYAESTSSSSAAVSMTTVSLFLLLQFSGLNVSAGSAIWWSRYCLRQLYRVRKKAPSPRLTSATDCASGGIYTDGNGEAFVIKDRFPIGRWGKAAGSTRTSSE